METIGNTAIQVSPDVPTEEEMDKVQDMFGRALNAVLAHADLTKKVDTLSRDVQTLTARLESEVWYAQNLNTSLNETRQERDNLKAEVSSLNLTLHRTNLELEQVGQARDMAQSESQQLHETLTRVRRESDDHAFKALELDEALQAERAKVRKVQAELESFKANIEKVLGSMTQAMQASEPYKPAEVGHVPLSEPVADMSQPKDDPWLGHGGGMSEPVGQRATDPIPDGPSPAPTPEAPSEASNAGTSEPGAGGSQDKPWWERQQAEPEKPSEPSPRPFTDDYYRN